MLHSKGESVAGSVLHEVLHENAVPVSLSATRRPAQRSAAPDRSAVVIHLGMDAAPAPALDTGRLARAVEDLIRAIDPSLAGTRVEVQVTPGHGLTGEITSEDEEAGADFHLDLIGRILSVDGLDRMLTRREFELLAYLNGRRGVALSRRELMNAVWHTSYLVGDRTIDVHVRRLRVKLGRHADRLRTLRGYGYRLD